MEKQQPDATDMNTLNDLKKGYSAITQSELEGGGFAPGQVPVISAVTDIEKSDFIVPGDLVIIDEASSNKAKFKDVIVVGGNDSGLPYKLTDIFGGMGVVCKVRNVPTHGDVDGHLQHLINRNKREVKPPKPITLRNLFDVPRK